MNNPWPGIRFALEGALALAALSTFGDWLWTHYIPDGEVIPGVVHGAVIFLALALILGRAAGTPKAVKRLLATLPVAGILLAALFYPIAMLTKNYLVSLLITWVGMWLILATLQRWARDNHETLQRALLRGVLASIGSGLAFWAISGIWTSPSPDGPNYLWHFGCWAFAFFPGLAALFVE